MQLLSVTVVVSTLYLSTDLDALADEMASLLDSQLQREDCFRPTTIVVPNRYLAKWLRLRLARRLGVVMNVRFCYLETAIWQMLKEMDGRPDSAAMQPLEDDMLQLLILHSLIAAAPHLLQAQNDDGGSPLDSGDRANLNQALIAELAGMDGSSSVVESCRRVWRLSALLTRLFRDYDYHRYEQLLVPWDRDQDAYAQASSQELHAERRQRAVHRQVMRPDGLLAALSKASGKRQLTLSQYVREVQCLSPVDLNRSLQGASYLFGISHISTTHTAILRWLGEHRELRLFHLNPLVGLFKGSRRQEIQAAASEIANAFREGVAEAYKMGPAHEPLRAWGRAGAESLWSIAQLLSSPQFEAEVLPARKQRIDQSLLGYVQQSLLSDSSSAIERKDQDRSLQIVACPGVYREVETVYQSILHNLHEDRRLRQTDIAVLVTDMPRYRPVLQAVFDRQPGQIVYNLADFSAAALSCFGQALLGMLDLAMEAFTRSRVFQVLLNPCYLAKLAVERDEALIWLGWAEELGIYHGWDTEDKRARGYADSALFSWELGLQRLRLGRLMEVVDEDCGQPVSSFQNVVPFQDLASSDKEQLNAFCQAIEGLLPWLQRLRSLRTTGSAWADELRRLVHHCLAIPPDRAEEEQVRNQLLRALDRLARIDQLPGARPWPLPLVREFVRQHLETLEGTKGEYLTGGVTISTLQPVRPVPFDIVYVLGLDESSFPGSDAMSSMDLRSRERLPGDIRPTELNRFLFLETLLAARRKLYLLYNCRDLQKDQEFYPSSTVTQLQRYVEQHWFNRPFQISHVPLRPDDPAYAKELRGESPHADVLITNREVDRLLAVEESRTRGELHLDRSSALELDRRLVSIRRSFVLPQRSAARAAEITLPLRRLRDFLRHPAEAALHRHLYVEDEEPIEPCDDEPFYTSAFVGYRLTLRTLEQFVLTALTQSPEQAWSTWEAEFERLYEEWRWRGRLPEDAFGEIDRCRFRRVLQQRIGAADGLDAFVRERKRDSFTGPVLIGETIRPVRPRLRFPGLTLHLPQMVTGAPCAVRLVGSLPFVWRDADALEILALTNAAKVPNKDLSVPALEPLLFYLALLAGDWAINGPKGGARIQDLGLRLHIAYPEGLATLTYAPGMISPAEARDYFSALLQDYLNPTIYEDLRFDIIAQHAILRKAYQLPDEVAELEAVRREYTQRLRSFIERDEEFPRYSLPLLELLNPSIPENAFDQVRRRFRLLDRGPASLRQRKEPARAES